MNDVLNLSEAKKLTGFSDTRFTYATNRNALRETPGVSVDGPGKSWKIPVKVLVDKGWLNEDLSQIPKSPRGRKKGATTTTTNTASPILKSTDIAALSKALDEARTRLTASNETVAAKTAEVRALRKAESELHDATTKQKANATLVKALEKRFRNVKATALEEAERAFKEAEQKLAATQKALGIAE